MPWARVTIAPSAKPGRFRRLRSAIRTSRITRPACAPGVAGRSADRGQGCPSTCVRAQVSLRLQVEEDLLRRLLRAEVGADGHVRVLGGLVGIRDAGELLDEPRPRFRVETLAVPRLADLEGRGHVHED